MMVCSRAGGPPHRLLFQVDDPRFARELSGATECQIDSSGSAGVSCIEAVIDGYLK